MATDRAARLPDPPLLIVTDRQQAALPIDEVVAQALDAGCRWIMLREKDLPTASLALLAGRLVGRARAVGATIVVNGDLAAAKAADGIHLPQGQSVAAAREVLGAAALIGVSAHDLAEAEDARRRAADYATLSPVFLTDSKPGYGPALGPPGLAAVARLVALPLIALGGVEPATVAACRNAGAAGIAAMGSVMRSPQPGRTVRALIAAWRNA